MGDVDASHGDLVNKYLGSLKEMVTIFSAILTGACVVDSYTATDCWPLLFALSHIRLLLCDLLEWNCFYVSH